MIVCSCNVLTDHDVRTAVAAEARPRSTGQVYGCLGCSAQCGRCARTIRKIMDEALDARRDRLRRLRPAAKRPEFSLIFLAEIGGGCRHLVLAETNLHV